VKMLVIVVAVLAGCDNNGTTPDWSRMITQPKLQAFGASDLFDDGAAMRPIPRGTVARERVGDVALREGRTPAGRPIDALPIAITRPLLERGRERFAIVCATCHGLAGDGDSAVAHNMQRRRPPSLHDPRIAALTPGALYRVIVDGYGLMPSYATMLGVDDRWSVVAYVRTLELSWHVDLAALPVAIQTDVARRLP
jgi:mono/diheme cytochrome c family protein